MAPNGQSSARATVMQKAYYSGKKKRHNVKNVLLADRTCQVPFLSDTYEGSHHDKPVADQKAYPLPAGSELLQDLGFVGFTLDSITITQPHKKPRFGLTTVSLIAGISCFAGIIGILSVYLRQYDQ